MSRHSVMYIGPYYIHTYHSALKTTCSTGFLKRLQYFDFANNSASIASIDVHANAIYWKDVLYVNFRMHLFIGMWKAYQMLLQRFSIASLEFQQQNPQLCISIVFVFTYWGPLNLFISLHVLKYFKLLIQSSI